MGRAVEAIEGPKAEARKKAHQNKPKNAENSGSGNLPPPDFGAGETGKTRDKVGEAVGMSGRTYDNAKTVVQAAEADPAVRSFVDY